LFSRIFLDNGYIEDNNYYFYVRDHLGNNRIVTDASGANVLQSNEYYPFGMLMSNSTHADKQPYKYSNKELDTSFDLNWYDFSARYQDGIRFTSIDPHAENYYSWSPYVYCYNNPLRFVDPTGKDGWDIFWGTIDGVVDNLSLPFLPTPNNTDKVTSASDYNTGRSIGDIASIAMGVAEIFIGGNVAGRGVGVAVASGGSGIAAAGTGVAVGTGIMGHGVNTIYNALKKDGRMSEMNNSGNQALDNRTAKDPLRRDNNGEPLPDPEAKGTPHTQLGTKTGRKETYKQAREFDSSNKPVRDIDFTDHGRPTNHTNPHQHKYRDNSTGGTKKRDKKNEPLDY